jgi:hypothetical protein
MSEEDRPAVNEFFNPDESCDFDAYQLNCIPGSYIYLSERLDPEQAIEVTSLSL